ncbi:MAG: hypothetical protein HY308_09120 [Gammaproteobacteria bacterium]|nr:hypothetical protein [Gammaproteobacteria bacterium]
MSGQLFFFIATVVLGLAATVVGYTCMAGREPERRLLAAVSVVPIVVVLSMLALGATGHLTGVSGIIFVTGFSMLLAAVSGFFGNNSSLVKKLGAEAVFLGARGTGWYVGAAVLLSVWGRFTIDTLFEGTRFSTDDLIYHAPAVAHWLQDGRLSLAAKGFATYYPMNAELLSLWSVLPFHGDGMANMAGWFWITMGTVSVVALCRILGCSGATAMLGGAFFVASPVVASLGTTFSAVDAAGTAAMMAALTLSMSSASGNTVRTRWVDAWYAGLLMGLAVGIKVSFAPAVLVVGWLCLSGYEINDSRKVKWQALLIFAAAVALTGSYWYLRNLMLSGNPIFPADFGPFPGPFGRDDQFRTTLAYWMRAAGTNVALWKEIIRTYLGWGFCLGLLAFLGYFVSAYRSLRLRAISSDEMRWKTLAVFMLGVILLLAHPFMPFSGTIDSPDAGFVPMQRYIIGPFAIGLVLLAVVSDTWKLSRWLVLPVAIAAIVQSWVNVIPQSPVEFVGGVAFGVVFAAGLWLADKSPKQFRGWRTPACGMFLVVVAVLAAWVPYKQALTDKLIETYAGGKDSAAGDAWALMRLVPNDARVTAFGPDMWMYYPLFGRRLRVSPQPGDENGAAYVHYHLRQPRSTRWWWHDSPATFSAAEFLENLRNRNIDFVLTTKGDSQEWPPQYAALMRSNTADLIRVSEHSALWKIRRTYIDKTEASLKGSL